MLYIERFLSIFINHESSLKEEILVAVHDSYVFGHLHDYSFLWKIIDEFCLFTIDSFYLLYIYACFFHSTLQFKMLP